MYDDPEGTMAEWLKWTLLGVGIAALIVASVFTFGGAAGAASTIAAAVAVGGAISGGMTLIQQIAEDNFDPGELGISLLCGEVYGLIVGFTGGAATPLSAISKIGLSGVESLLYSWNNDFSGDAVDDMLESMATTTMFQIFGLSRGASSAKGFEEIIAKTALIRCIKKTVSSAKDEIEKICGEIKNVLFQY